MSTIESAPIKDVKGYLSPEEVRRIIEVAENLHDRLMIRLLWVTGCRVSELVGDKTRKKVVAKGVHVDDIIWNDKVIVMETLKRKRPYLRRVPIDDETIRMLMDYVSKYKIRGKLFDITRQRVFQILRETGRRAGITNVGNGKLHPHHLRHSHCVAWVKANNNMEGLRRLQRRVGHASIATTAHYLQFAESREEVEEVFGKW